MNTNIVITLSTGKEIELTQEEYHELLNYNKKNILCQLQYYPYILQPLVIPPLQYTPYPHGWPEIICSVNSN